LFRNQTPTLLSRKIKKQLALKTTTNNLISLMNSFMAVQYGTDRALELCNVAAVALHINITNTEYQRAIIKQVYKTLCIRGLSRNSVTNSIWTL